ncbi:MazG family protein [Streptosporangium lutulentum]
MDRLRVNCPWDAQQTHESLAPYLLEEAYEVLETIEEGDHAALREELGDLLLQVAFHARVAQERPDGFDVDDVADAIVSKLVRRHPHVFADTVVDGAGEVSDNWETIKAAERAAKNGGDSGSVVDGVPMGQPALSLTAQLLRRAERVGAPAELLGRTVRRGRRGTAFRARTAGARGGPRPGGRAARRRPRLPGQGPRPGVVTEDRARVVALVYGTGPISPGGRPRAG